MEYCTTSYKYCQTDPSVVSSVEITMRNDYNTLSQLCLVQVLKQVSKVFV